jgi:hypothetical protein
VKGDPSKRANVHFQLKRERVWLKIKIPGWLGGTKFELNSEVFSESALSTAMTTSSLVGAGCLLAGVAFAIGVPGVTALIVGVCTPIAIYTLIRLMSGRETR